MPTDLLVLIGALAVVTFAVRLAGVYFGALLPADGPVARALEALPGCLIVSLVAMLLLSGDRDTWIATVPTLAVALVTRNLPVTMAVGIATVMLLRQLG
ncbi:MAG: AzlD domain-containing protein [Pseudomonadota bacterium]